MCRRLHLLILHYYGLDQISTDIPLPSHHVLINIDGPFKSVTTNGNQSHVSISLPQKCSCSPGQMPAVDIKFQTPELIADALPA